MRIEGFTERLKFNRHNWINRHPEYSLPEATAAVVMDTAREITAEMIGLGKTEKAIEIISSGELKRRNDLIINSPAYARFGAYWNEEIKKFMKGEIE